MNKDKQVAEAVVPFRLPCSMVVHGIIAQNVKCSVGFVIQSFIYMKKLMSPGRMEGCNLPVCIRLQLWSASSGTLEGSGKNMEANWP